MNKTKKQTNSKMYFHSRYVHHYTFIQAENIVFLIWIIALILLITWLGFFLCVCCAVSGCKREKKLYKAHSTKEMELERFECLGNVCRYSYDFCLRALLFIFFSLSVSFTHSRLHIKSPFFFVCVFVNVLDSYQHTAHTNTQKSKTNGAYIPRKSMKMNVKYMQLSSIMQMCYLLWILRNKIRLDWYDVKCDFNGTKFR